MPKNTEQVNKRAWNGPQLSRFANLFTSQ